MLRLKGPQPPAEEGEERRSPPPGTGPRFLRNSGPSQGRRRPPPAATRPATGRPRHSGVAPKLVHSPARVRTPDFIQEENGPLFAMCGYGILMIPHHPPRPSVTHPAETPPSPILGLPGSGYRGFPSLSYPAAAYPPNPRPTYTFTSDISLYRGRAAPVAYPALPHILPGGRVPLGQEEGSGAPWCVDAP